ncbi:MAG TPA: hypothetical protein VHE30_09290 [Polyangiaceae bacterium]|nr:hypothetical protein [Polyangiaceae bacterium]
MNISAAPRIIGFATLLTLSLVSACSSSSSDNLGTTGPVGDGGPNGNAGTSGGSNGGGSNGGGSNTGGLWGGVEGGLASVCANATCNDGKDNDGDGLVDGFDPECTNPCDDDEASFATGIPGDNVDPKWQDCFFDGNSGGGDDGCRYSTKCLTGELPQTDKACTVTQQCLDYCKPLVSNGCDCFGCCTVQTSGGPVDIQIGTSCSLADIGDTSKCPTCKKSTECQNTCGTCELCLGKTEADLPSSCKPPQTDAGTPNVPDGSPPPPPPPTYTCDLNQVVCSASQPCKPGYYCTLGCCKPILR